jgi:hypothetical protein
VTQLWTHIFFSHERSSTGSNDCFVVVVVVVVGISHPLVIFSLKVFLCRAVAHQVKNGNQIYCKSRIVGRELPKSLLGSLNRLKVFSRGLMNERIFSLVIIFFSLLQPTIMRPPPSMKQMNSYKNMRNRYATRQFNEKYENNLIPEEEGKKSQIGKKTEFFKPLEFRTDNKRNNVRRLPQYHHHTVG